MSKDLLRLKSANSKTDLSVNKYSAKENVKRKVHTRADNSTISLIVDEIYDSQSSALVREEQVKKPKIIECISFVFAYVIGLIVLFVLTATINNLFAVFVLAIVSALFVPLAFLYFFYKIDARGKLKFSTIAYCVWLGFLLFILIDFTFDKLLTFTMSFQFYVVTVRCIVELITIISISVIIAKSRAKYCRTSTILIGVSVSSGFALAEALGNNLNAMLIGVEVYQFGSTVGAIINVPSYIEVSATNLMAQVSVTSFVNTLLIIMLAVITTDIITDANWSFGKRTITAIFTFLFCWITYVLTKVNTPFSALATLYDVISLGVTLYLFGRMVNSCIREEKYE